MCSFFAFKSAFAALGSASIVMCHISHAYEDGASLYFTFFARARQGAELEQWGEAKTAACEAIVASAAACPDIAAAESLLVDTQADVTRLFDTLIGPAG